MKTIALSFLLAAQSLTAAPPSASEPIELDLNASPTITINRENALKEGITPNDISETFVAFIEAHDQFTLEELKDIGIKTLDGGTVKLSQVASIDVIFRKAPPKRPAEQAAPASMKENSEFTDKGKLIVNVDHRIERNELIVTATVKNQSNKPVTFVNHPDFCGISVYAANRDKDESINGGLFLHNHRATAEYLKVVRPGKSFEYQQSFLVRHSDDGTIEIEEYPQFDDTKSFMRISDDKLQAVFRYGRYPDRLPEDSNGQGHNFVMVDLESRKLFTLPKNQEAKQDAVQPATAPDSKPQGNEEPKPESEGRSK